MLPLSKVKYIVVHYSATPIEKSFTAADIDAMHRKERGFRKIGYHRYIRRSGLVESGRTVTATQFEDGAHAKGYNEESLGVCYEGGVTLADPKTGRNTMTPAQEACLDPADQGLEGAVLAGGGRRAQRPAGRQHAMPRLRCGLVVGGGHPQGDDRAPPHPKTVADHGFPDWLPVPLSECPLMPSLDNKPLLSSKTFWLNILALVAVFANRMGQVIDPLVLDQIAVALAGVGSIILRARATQRISGFLRS